MRTRGTFSGRAPMIHAQGRGSDRHPVEQETARHATERRAHELFEMRGRADGRDVDDWLQAEREVTQTPGVIAREIKSSLLQRRRLDQASGAAGTRTLATRDHTAIQRW